MNVNLLSDEELAKELDRHFDVHPDQLIEVAQFIRQCVKDSMPTEKEIKIIIQQSELWRMSNYVGREDSSYSKDGLSGTERLAHALREAMEGAAG